MHSDGTATVPPTPLKKVRVQVRPFFIGIKIMHYFKRNIGDYHKKAGRLSMIEHGAYTLLMDACYDREQFPTLEQAYDWCWARTDDEKNAVEFVLEKFFVFQDGVYFQSRIAEELEQYHKNAETNRRIAIEREEKKRTNREQTVNEHSTNQHLTNNQEPLTINHKPKTNKTNSDEFDVFWKAYPRKVGKDKALIAWNKKKPNLDAVLNALSWQKLSDGWIKDNGQYIPHPTTYLNEGRWQDEPSMNSRQQDEQWFVNGGFNPVNEIEVKND